MFDINQKQTYNTWMIQTEPPPYSSPELNAHFAASVSGSNAAAINHITVVGGLFDAEYTLLTDDINTITRTLKVLERANITVSQAPHFDFYNLIAPLSNDFLRATIFEEQPQQTDLIIVCGIWGGKSME